LEADEVRALAAEAGLAVMESFAADGAGGNLADYAVLAASHSP
jgi:hypothetical protein